MKQGSDINIFRGKCVIPLLRERIILMYSAPKYRKESVFSGSFTSLVVESLNIRFLAGAWSSEEKRLKPCKSTQWW